MPSSNGQGPQLLPGKRQATHADALEVIAALRVPPRNVSAFRGFGPLVAAVVLFVVMLWLAPSVAPEHIVDKPVNAPAATTTTVTK